MLTFLRLHLLEPGHAPGDIGLDLEAFGELIRVPVLYPIPAIFSEQAMNLVGYQISRATAPIGRLVLISCILSCNASTFLDDALLVRVGLSHL